jgi:HAD superfamily hydrolase (TIGR01509 family)
MMTKQIFEGLFLDLDGTIIDSSPMIYEVVKELFQINNLGEVSETMLEEHAGLPPREFFEVIAPDQIDFLIKQTAALEDKHRALAPLFPGVATLLTEISNSGFPLAVITSQADLEMALVKTSYEFSSLIDFWICSDDVTNPKPDPESILIALDFFGIPGSKTLFVGDSVYDINAGKNAGVKTGAALWGGNNKNEMKSLKPDFLFSKPSEIKKCFIP